MARMLETEEAARRLGVKVTTLYAYVSRGVLASHPAPDGRRSLFVAEDVERLARRARGGRRVETRLATVTTAVTQLREDGPAYRGTPAVVLAGTRSFEDVAELLWNAGPDERGPWEAARVPAVEDFGFSDRLRWALIAAGASDRLRSDRRPIAVLAAARRAIATMVAALAPATPSSGTPSSVTATASRSTPRSIAHRLASALCVDPSPEVVAFVDATMVLLADNELATSTVAVRIAASTRADIYDALLAGLATLAGPFHGGASEQAYDLLLAVSRDGARAVDEALRWQDRLPGFSTTVYGDVDPRFTVLEGYVGRLAPPEQRATLGTVLELAATRDLPPPNVDLGIAALLHATAMPRDAGRTMFAVARAAGWTAHYLEEMGEPPLRFRPRAIYAAN
jgi:citrate synthase